MFIFYGNDNVSTHHPKILGISATSDNVKAEATSAPVDNDPQRLNVVAKPLMKPVNTKWWVYIPDYFTWLVRSSSTVDESKDTFSVPTIFAAARPLIYHRSPIISGSELLPGPITVKVATTGVCFYSDNTHYIEAGYCPPDLKGDTLLGTLYLTAGYTTADKIASAYCPVTLCYENDYGLDEYKLLGLPLSTGDVKWNPMDGETTPLNRINKTFVELTYSFNTFADELNAGTANIPLVAYAYANHWNTFSVLQSKKVQVLLTDDYWKTSGTAGAPAYVVR